MKSFIKSVLSFNKMRVVVVGTYHRKNLWGLHKMIEYLGWTISDFNASEIVFSGSTYYDTRKYPDKVFVFGPHFSVFPNHVTDQFNGGVYIQPSQQVVRLWTCEFNYSKIPVKEFPFPVDIEKFSPVSKPKTDVFIYFKRRAPKELDQVKTFLNSKGIIYRVFVYGSYSEEEYMSFLNGCKYGIWIGSHESQGFALEEALSMNIPLLVWDVTTMKQEHGGYIGHPKELKMSTVPFWSDDCGECFETFDQLSIVFDTFIGRLGRYTPRMFIEEKLTVPVCANALKTICDHA